MLNGLLLSVDHIPLETWVVVTWVPQDLEVTADSFLGLVLGLALDVDGLVLFVEMAQHLVQEL